MGKKKTFLDKTMMKDMAATCPVCSKDIQYVRHVKAVRADNGAWRYRTVNVGVCKCNEKEIYG